MARWASLAGGFLMSTRLAHRAMTKEGEKDDQVVATALGPILIGSVDKPTDAKIGRVLGGAKSFGPEGPQELPPQPGPVSPGHQLPPPGRQS
jgi:hypothetical protein